MCMRVRVWQVCMDLLICVCICVRVYVCVCVFVLYVCEGI